MPLLTPLPRGRNRCAPSMLCRYVRRTINRLSMPPSLPLQALLVPRTMQFKKIAASEGMQ